MTDIIFLLLIFFMLTSNFVTPSGLPVNLPTSKASEIVMQKISVTITKDLQYSINEQTTTLEALPAQLEEALAGTEQGEGVVVLHVDKSVPVEHFVKVAGIANNLKAKVSIASLPSE